MKDEPVRIVVTGGFPRFIPIMNQQTVESMVTHTIQCSCNGFVGCLRYNDRGLAGTRDLLLRHLDCGKETQGKTSSQLCFMLKDVLSRCPQFCRDELALARPEVISRWRETNSRKVLEPLTLKQNTENIIAGKLDMSRKRKSDTPNCWIPKHAKLEASLKPCSVVIKRASLRVLLLKYRCIRNKPFVKLFDVLQEIPQVKQEEKPATKSEYMGFFGLFGKDLPNAKASVEIKTSHPVKLTSHPQIPFSSDYGKRLLARESHNLPEEVALRKIERTEWYLKGTTSAVKDHTDFPEVIIQKSTQNNHIYKFPKRQYHHKHHSLDHAFKNYCCKPLSVELKRIDITPYLLKMQKMQADQNLVKESTKEEVSVVSETDAKVLTVNCAMTIDGPTTSEPTASLRPRSCISYFEEKFLVARVGPKKNCDKHKNSLKLNNTT